MALTTLVILFSIFDKDIYYVGYANAAVVKVNTYEVSRFRRASSNCVFLTESGRKFVSGCHGLSVGESMRFCVSEHRLSKRRVFTSTC